MASLSIPALPPPVIPASAPGTLPSAPVGAVTGAVPVALMQAELRRIQAAPNLSKNVLELVGRALGEA